LDSRLYITQYAGITVMLPAAIVVAGWLWCTASKKLALLWLVVLSVAYFVVGLSKVLFKGWGIGLESLDIAVISGHAMNACLVSTVVLSLLLRQIDHRLRWLALGAGLLSTWWFSVEYVGQTIHPVAEAIAGAVVGSAAACVFLFRLEKKDVRKIPLPALGIGLAVILLSTSIPKYTAEGVLNSLAVTLSGAEKAFMKPHWRGVPVSSRF
jgi:hypothetical protein